MAWGEVRSGQAPHRQPGLQTELFFGSALAHSEAGKAQSFAHPLSPGRKMSFDWQEEEINVILFGFEGSDPGRAFLQAAAGWGRRLLAPGDFPSASNSLFPKRLE